MDAAKLPPPAAVAPAAARATVTSTPDAATVMDVGATAIAGRFLISGKGMATATGELSDARDTQQGGTQVSIKLVNADVLPNASMADRALRELKQLAKVSSDRIVKVLDQGRAADGRVYVATEQVSGPTLEELVAHGGPLPVERATAIVLQIGEALTEAQKVGVIHRDVAPRNVFVLPGDKVKVGEFGLAEAVNEKVFGAPAYISPEQVEGKPVDQRSNIYSLGAVFYYALTGHPPFQGDPASLLTQQVSATAPPPSTKRAGLPAELDRIILKALEKSGGRRHLTLRQLLSEIEAAQGAKAAAPEANARTVMAMAPGHHDAPSPSSSQSMTAPREASRGNAATMMGIPSPMGKPATAPSMATAPATTPNMSSAPATSPNLPAADGQARTMMAEAPKLPAPTPVQAPSNSAAAKSPLNASPQVQAAVAQAQANAAAKAAATPPAKGGFRETAWFKAGEIQEEMDKAQAAAASEAGGDPLAKTGTTGQHTAMAGGEVDVSKVDVDAQDKARLSLKTGATQMMAAVKMPTGAVPGERMDEQEMLAEIDSSKKWFLIAGAIVGAVVLAVVLYFLLGNKGDPRAELPPPSKPEAVAAAPPPTPTASPPAATLVAKPAAPPHPAAPPTSAASNNSAEMIAEAQSAVSKENLTLAVDLLTRAIGAGADLKATKKLEANLGKAVAKRIATAKKKKDKEGEAEGKALAARLKSLKAATRK